MAPIDSLGLSKQEAESRAQKLLNDVGLYSKRDNYPDELSGGQKQRISIARCLAKINIYYNDCSKTKLSCDEIRSKIFESYCKNMRSDENDEGYDMHISFEVVTE